MQKFMLIGIFFFALKIFIIGLFMSALISK